MCVAAEKLPLPPRDVRKKKLPRRCCDAMAYKLAAAATVLDQKYWY
jgi:hypothetical protein